MPTYVIVKAQEDILPDDLTRYQIGYPIYFFGQSALTGRVVPPKYCQFCVTDEDDFEGLKASYNKEWRKLIDWEFVGHDYELDGHRLKVWMQSSVVSVTGLNNLTRAQVESWLNNWNAIVYSAATNEVVFDVTVFDAISSPGFWNRDVSQIEFTEKDYDRIRGVHSIEVDYSAASFTSEQVEQAIVDIGGEVTSAPTNKVNFDIQRSTVFDEFKIAVKEAIENQMYSRRQFKIPEEYIQMALDSGGTLDITKAQLVKYIHNRLDD